MCTIIIYYVAKFFTQDFLAIKTENLSNNSKISLFLRIWNILHQTGVHVQMVLNAQI